MIQRVVPAVLIVLLVVIHAQMWVGRGSVPSVAALQRKLDLQKAANAQAKLANDQLASEVDDLKAGLGIVEEKARVELGMVRPNEIFVQVAR
ncbi:septum formation initiator family protein [Ottowia sp.]|jgi:cell division protein FtsB|uniref:septum formation initiator family protein n=1 Tax=Ottowia sp. TaxID=1898956 RepID=UPI0025DE7F31|nr:septum formation initiator family protein [Ottowia sp.]MBK6612704.1 septum formation initiator family protein [Ottowia sp.]MBK6748169.1 septum formation initiator family protein [Ottowia sp.]